MDVTEVLLDILIVLVAAKVAAEASERVGLPAVVGEIVAGILIGPSLLGLVGGDDEVLRTLGELGVILLLLEVGLQMDLRELGAVGRASLSTAVVGVAAPMLGGLAVMQLLGGDFETALFVGAALTATSVGITARVFGDLRALGTLEARIVLGAAVADDVIGLVVLTVVVRLVTGGSVTLPGVVWIVVVAIGFLVVGGLAALKVAPPLFSRVERAARSRGTLVALALAFTLAFAELAHVAKLAPIVGAFVAGLALSRTEQAERIERELTPVGHLFIPVFFLQIGIDADIGAFGRPTVLRDAALLLAVAVAGKLLSAVGCLGTGADKATIGLGMLPRGEVGLIFATIGLANGVLDDELYAALLLVVLSTTLLTPPLLKMRTSRRAESANAGRPAISQPPPAGGYLDVLDGRVKLTATPPGRLGLTVALQAAALMAQARPSPDLIDWLAALRDDELRWRSEGAPAFSELLEQGNSRSWRFLDTTGVLRRVFPELASTVRARQADPLEIDPAATHHFWLLDRLRQADHQGEAAALRHRPWMLLTGLLVEALDGRPDQLPTARRIMRRLDLGAAAEQHVTALVADRELLWSALRHPDALHQEPVVRLAGRLENAERARALFLLSLAMSPDVPPWRRDRLHHLHQRLQFVLARPELVGLDTRNQLNRRRARAVRLVEGQPAMVERIEAAPVAHLLAFDESVIARQAELLANLSPSRPTAAWTGADGGGWSVEVAARSDRLLGVTARVLAPLGLVPDLVALAAWPDGSQLITWYLDGSDGDGTGIDGVELAQRVAAALSRRQRDVGDGQSAPSALRWSAGAPPALRSEGSTPWTTRLTASWPRDRHAVAVLAELTNAFDHERVLVVGGRVQRAGGELSAQLDVVDHDGAPLELAAWAAPWTPPRNRPAPPPAHH